MLGNARITCNAIEIIGHVLKKECLQNVFNKGRSARCLKVNIEVGLLKQWQEAIFYTIKVFVVLEKDRKQWAAIEIIEGFMCYILESECGTMKIENTSQYKGAC